MQHKQTSPSEARSESSFKPATTSSHLSYKVAHAAFAIGCASAQLEALLDGFPTCLAVDRQILFNAMTIRADLICKELGVLKGQVDDLLRQGIQDFLRKSFSATKTSTRKRPSGTPKSGNVRIIDVPTLVTSWNDLVFRLVASIPGAERSLQAWFNMGRSLGLVDVAMQTNSSRVREYLQDAQQAAKVLQEMMEVPACLRALADLQFGKSLNGIAAQLRRVASLGPRPEAPMIHEPYAEWSGQSLIAKEISILSLSVQWGLEALAQAEVRVKPGNDIRDAMMYQLRQQGLSLKAIRTKLEKEHPEFDVLATDQAVSAAIERYAKRHNLPSLTKPRKRP